MNIVIILSVILGVALAQQGDIKDCEPRQSALSVRDVQDIYQRPVGYDQVDYTPHSTYGPPDPVRTTPRRNYPQDAVEAENGPRSAYAAPPPVYNDIRQQFPFAPVYGPAPPRARVAAAAGIYDDYEDLQYNQPPTPLLPPAIRRYNINYAQREPYQPVYGYDSYSNRYQHRVPVFYAPLPEGYYPIRSAPPTPATTTTTTTTEEPRTVQPSITAPITPSISHPITQAEQSIYEEQQGRRHHPIITVSSSEEEIVHPRHKFRKPFLGLANLFRGSIIASRNKIGVIPSLVQGSVNKLT